jgi:hypothetical protein
MPNSRRYKALNSREVSFCRHFLVSDNATRAALAAGYSRRGAKVRAHLLLQREAVLDEIERLRRVHEKAVNSALTGATSSKELAEVSCWPLQLRRDVDAEVVALVDRNYAIAAIVEGLEMALGRRPMTISTVKERQGGGARVNIIKVDLHAAARCAELLLKHLGPARATESTGPDVVAPEIVAVLDGFRAVVIRHKRRLGLPDDGESQEAGNGDS